MATGPSGQRRSMTQARLPSCLTHPYVRFATEPDESRIRRGNGPHNMGVIRHVAMNLLKGETSKISVRKKRIRAGFSDDFRDKILMGR